MKTIAINIFAVIAGIIVGGLVNSGLVHVGPMIVPLPEGVDVTTVEGLRAGMDQLGPANFLFPFLAHALGTLVGAFVAAALAASHGAKLAMVIGVFFLAGGIAAVSMIGGPMWFIVLDLVVAYIPMAWLGAVLARATRRRVPSRPSAGAAAG